MKDGRNWDSKYVDMPVFLDDIHDRNDQPFSLWFLINKQC